MDAIKILQEDAKAIYIGNLNTVDADLTLPVEGKNGSVIKWQTNRPYTVSETGKVIRPHAGTGDREAVLTACLSYGGETYERVFTLTVLARELNWTAVRLLPLEIRALQSEIKNIELPGVVIAEKDNGGFTALSVKWDPLPDMNAPGVYKIKGTPPLEKKPELIPEAVIYINEKQADTGAEDALPELLAAPFPPDRVSIEGGIFAANRDRMLEYLLNVNDDSMLYNFRDAAGIDTKDAPALTGWDAPECLLKGHTTGHYLSALALAVCCGVNTDAYRKKIRYMITGIAECQRVMGESGRFKDGFLSGYSEEQFDLLEQYVTYPNIWAPYYTLHKIFAGLLDCYELAGETEALRIAEKLGSWVYSRLSKCGEEKRRKMWSMYIAGEYGGMNEVMARLYRITPKEEYLQAARFFDNDLLFYPMSIGTDTLPGMHGNQHIPQMVGAVEMFERTGEMKYFNAAKNFWKIVTGSHIYSIGGVGEGEMFRDAGAIAANLSEKTAESCASYNMLKLTARLFGYAADTKMADYYERALYNHIAASHDQSGPTSGSTYFMPTGPGGVKGYDSDSNSCCHGTGLENHLKYQEMIYHHNGDALFVNLFIPSVLDWKEKGVRIRQTDGYLQNGAAELVIEGSADIILLLRIPGWLEEKPKLFINDTETEYGVKNGYAMTDRKFADGDTIRWSTPFSFRFEPSPDDGTKGTMFYGPLVMAAESDETEFLPIGGSHPEKTDDPLTFKCGGYALRPNYTLWDRPYHIYVNKTTACTAVT